ncbi:hypothetical protein GMOD_00006160 [Pyrenophora seminiperda CCB06]|uniref:Uncharacterized protein n=1 Tax=Pyrenophora seminiperda CCB06 TaxID=1302712 RepID=A0A3M7M4D9_9PLEO|nr:hypothetical protein GMOD_00006160 [Pyrenophora seminiperda CCB06]
MVGRDQCVETCMILCIDWIVCTLAQNAMHVCAVTEGPLNPGSARVKVPLVKSSQQALDPRW